jgi:hypothetical protein
MFRDGEREEHTAKLFGNKNIENKFVCSKWLSANEDLI